MNTSKYLNFLTCQELMAKPISNKPGENYIVATDDDNLISQYSKLFHNDGYNVEVIDLIYPANSSVSYDVLQQIESADLQSGLQISLRRRGFKMIPIIK